MTLLFITLAFVFSACGGGGSGKGGLPPDGSGAGISSDPFIVGSETTLRYVGRGAENPEDYEDWTLDKHYKLVTDIDLTDKPEWTPIGTFADRFTGSFDGNGNKIIGLSINKGIDVRDMRTPDFDYKGFFGSIAGATVKNLGLENVNIAGRSRVGGIAGHNHGGTVLNCYVTGDIRSLNDTTGGVVGYNGPAYPDRSGAANSMVLNCYAAGNVSSVYEQSPRKDHPALRAPLQGGDMTPKS